MGNLHHQPAARAARKIRERLGGAQGKTRHVFPLLPLQFHADQQRRGIAHDRLELFLQFFIETAGDKLARPIGKAEKLIAPAGLGGAPAPFFQPPGHHHDLLAATQRRRHALHIGKADDSIGGEHIGIGVNGVAAEEEAERLLLMRHALRQRPFDIGHHQRQAGMIGNAGRIAEQRHLGGLALPGGSLGAGHDGFGQRVHAGAVGVERIKAARRNQAFQLALVEAPRIDAAGEIGKILERALPVPFGRQRLHRLQANALQPSQGIAHVQRVFRPIHHGEIGGGPVDARRQDGDAGAARIIHEHRQPIGVVDIIGHGRGVEFGAVVRL